MTRKEYVKVQVDFLKMMMSTIVGVMFAISIYNLQTSGANLVNVTISIVITGIVSIAVYLVYNEYLKELKEMHKDEWEILRHLYLFDYVQSTSFFRQTPAKNQGGYTLLLAPW